MKTNNGNAGKVKTYRKTLYAWADKATRGRFKEAAVLRMLVHAAKPNLEASISQEHIAKALGVTDRTVRNILKKLVAAGLINSRLQYHSRTRKRVASIYTLNAVQDAELPEKITDRLPEKFSGPIRDSLSEERISWDIGITDSVGEEDTAPSTYDAAPCPDPWATLPLGNQFAGWRDAA